MATPDLITYGDLIDHLAIYTGGGALENEQRYIRAAAQAAYKQVAGAYDWLFYKTQERINCTAPYETGTVSTSTTTVTLAGGTWPTWARNGRILFDGDDVVYQVASRTSDSVVELDSTTYPATNVAAGTSYTLYRSVYPIPAGCRIEDFQGEDYYPANYVTPREWVELERHYGRSGVPWYFTLMSDPNFHGVMAFHVIGYPGAATSFDFLYQRTPRRLKYDGHEKYSSQDGSAILLTCSGTSATFDNVSMQTDVVGAMLRIGAAGATKPPRGRGDTNQYDAQQIISVRDNVDEVTLIDTIALSKTSDQFAISDPVDMPEYMFGALYRRCEYELATLMGDNKRMSIAHSQYQVALKEAMARDCPPASSWQRGFWPLDREIWIVNTT